MFRRYNISLRVSPSPFQGEGWGEGGCPHDYLQRLMSRLMGQQQGD